MDTPIRQCIRRRGDKYTYKGRVITSQSEIKRLNSISMPKAYKDVCFNRNAQAPLQATGKDKRGKMQYRYSDKEIQRNSSKKFQRMMRFAKLLPKIRKESRQLRGGGERDEKRQNVQQAVKLLDQCHFRVGNPKYLKENNSYGLSNLEVGHAKVGRNKGTISFVGKSGQHNTCEVTDPDTLRFLRGAIKRHAPKDRLFGYDGRGGRRAEIRPIDINRYLQTFDSQVSAKDFRTWQANVEVLRQLGSSTEPNPAKALKKAVDGAAKTLNHTPSVCKSNYIHPMVLEMFRSDRGTFDTFVQPYTRLPSRAPRHRQVQVLEHILYRMLQRFHR